MERALPISMGNIEMWMTILLLMTVLILHGLFKKKRINIPGPFRWPLVGNAISLGDEAHMWFHNMAKK